MKRPGALKRERVNRVLTGIFDYPLTIVEAPIGYGKTTAVRDFLSTRGGPVLWLSLVSTDDSASFFWDALASEIGRLDEAAGSRLRSLGFPSGAPQTVSILSILGELDFGEKTALVIDDFHLVRGTQIGALLAQIVKEEPDNLHIVVITRDTTNLDFAELTAKGLCNIVPQQLLRFTDAEVRDYCDMMGQPLNESEMRRICEYTGGWISLVYLILLGVEQGIPVGRNSAIDELVERVLYGAYDGRICGFLLQLSAMESFTAEQARFVTGETDTEELLRKLRRENAFIAYDDATGVYKIHNVLLDFLRMKQVDARERAALHRRVSEWHLARKEYKQAYAFLGRAGETERILALLDNEDTITNDFVEFDGALELFAATPRELLLKYPLAYLQYIGVLLMNGDQGAARDAVLRLNELQEVYGALEGIHPNHRSRVLAEISVIRIFAEFNDAVKMVACAKEALRLLEGGVSCLIKRESECTFGSPHFLYSYYREQGRLKETADLMVSEFLAFPALASGCGTGYEYVTLAEYALETGDWQAAELNAFKAIYKAETMGQTGIAICANLTLMRLYIFQGRATDAMELLRQLRVDVVKENNAVYNTTLELVEGYVYSCLGRLDSVPEWLRTGDTSPARLMYQGMGFNCIVHGKAALLSRDYIRLEVLTEVFAQYFSIFHNQLGFVHNQIFVAAAKCQLSGMEAGCAALRMALDMAREDRIILPFAECAPVIIEMVRRIDQVGPRDAYVLDVLRSCEQYLESLRHTPQSAVSLSAREREVLTLAAEGLKRDEIADRLHLSAGTVQTHLHNIYLKLEVGGRTAAIRKAQGLRLL